MSVSIAIFRNLYSSVGTGKAFSFPLRRRSEADLDRRSVWSASEHLSGNKKNLMSESLPSEFIVGHGDSIFIFFYFLLHGMCMTRGLSLFIIIILFLVCHVVCAWHGDFTDNGLALVSYQGDFKLSTPRNFNSPKEAPRPGRMTRNAIWPLTWVHSHFYYPML